MVNKYHARRTDYEGRTYDSKLEAEFARWLDIARLVDNSADRVVWVAEQVPFYFPWGRRHRLDFMVGKADGATCFVEVKGQETRDALHCRQILEYFLDHPITVWKGGS